MTLPAEDRELNYLLRAAAGGRIKPHEVERLRVLLTWEHSREPRMNVLLAGLREAFAAEVRAAVNRATSEALNSGDGSLMP